MNSNFLLLLGANQFQRERALIGVEKAFDGQVITVSPNAPFVVNKYALNTFNSNENNPDQLLKDTIQFCRKTKLKPTLVVPLNDFVLRAGQKIAEYFKLPYNTEQTILASRTKDLMKLTLLEANLPAIRSYRFSNIDEARLITKTINFPCVIKPLNFGGSGGVIKVDSISQLENSFLITKEHIQKHATKYDSDQNIMLMEPYISIKNEVSVEVINTPTFRKVIGITDKFLGPEPFFSEIGHSVPSKFEHNKELAEKIKQVALKACEALNITYGLAHVELKVNDEGKIYILEVGARPGGDGIMDLYEKSMNVNLYSLHTKSYLNNLSLTNLPTKFFNTTAIAYLHPTPGIVKKVNFDSLTEADLENVTMISLQARPGAIIEEAKDWSTRNGFVHYTLGNGKQGFDLIQHTKNIAHKIFQVN